MPAISSITGSPTLYTPDGDECYEWITPGVYSFYCDVGGLVEFLIVGGGSSGAGGGNFSAGGGTAGAYRRLSFIAVAGETYTITVGAGGASVTNANSNAGSPSGITGGTNAPGLIDGGGVSTQDGTLPPAQSEASGGGAGGFVSGVAVLGGTGGTYGNDGGATTTGSNSGGGGGAGSAGASGDEEGGTGGAGGDGISDDITGVAVIRAAGAGGAPIHFFGAGQVPGPGGLGGAASGTSDPLVAPETPAAGTGSGGGASNNGAASAPGASGAVIIRFTPEAGGSILPQTSHYRRQAA